MGRLASALEDVCEWISRQWRRWRGKSRYEVASPDREDGVASASGGGGGGNGATALKESRAKKASGRKAKAKAKAASASSTVRPKYSWETRKHVDPEDFMLRGLEAETRLKRPGQINGQQFLIDNCKASKIFLFDHSAAVTIEKCTDCTIVVGPVEGSIFIRECARCIVAVVCQQFRSRECSNIDVFLYSSTRPIIEESVNMRFGCYDMEYKGLSDQMKLARISPFSNLWSDVYDYTPGDGHISCIPQGGCTYTACCSTIDSSALDLPDDFFAKSPSYLIKTLGNSLASMSLRGEECFVLMDESDALVARKVIQGCSTGGASLIRTTHLKLSSSTLRDTMLNTVWHDNKPLFFAQVAEVAAIGLEIRGWGCLGFVKSILPPTSTALVTSNMQLAEECRRSSSNE